MKEERRESERISAKRDLISSFAKEFDLLVGERGYSNALHSMRLVEASSTRENT